jgi:SusD family.
MYGWNKANEEWVWGAVLIDEQQTSYASFFSHIDPFFGGYCTLGNHHVMSESVFNFLKDSDTRKILHQPLENFGKNYYNGYFGGKPRSSFKFTGMGEWTNDYIYIKSGEMYLIAAEAYYMDKNEGKAKDILDEINKARTIDGAEFIGTDKTGNDLLNEILMYRRAELWGDGQRFLDMKRLNVGCEGRVGQPLAELTPEIKAGDKRFTFLIPKQEMDSNPNMKQNTL